MSFGADDLSPPVPARRTLPRRTSRLLVVAPPRVTELVARIVPTCVNADSAGLDPTDADVLLLALDADGRWRATLREALDAAPGLRVVLCCAVADEPLARQALESGVADYCLWPLDRDELEAALSLPDPFTRDRPAEPGAGPTADSPTQVEVARLSRVLQAIPAGPQCVADALAELLRDVYAADSACVEVDGVRAVLGRPADAPGEDTLLASVMRDGAVVGRLGVAVTEPAADRPSDTPLKTYANLAGVLMAQARDHERLRRFAQTDALSGLCNRRQFDLMLAERFEQASRARRQLTLFLFDIDDFKTYNDRYGHAAGDGLIREIGVLLTRCSRSHDVVARFGGDEFAVIFCEPEVPRVAGSRPPTDAMALAGRFSTAIARHHFRCLGPDAPGPVTISGGLATHPWDAVAPDALVAAADAALLEAKRTGKNRIVLAGRAAP